MKRMETRKVTFKVMKDVKVAALTAAISLVSAGAQAQTLKISVQDAQFTQSAIERLVAEYSKQNPSFHAEVVKGAQVQADATVSLSAEEQEHESTVGRFVVLPIANAQNELLNVKKVQRGLNDKLEQQLFVERDIEDEISAREDGEKALPGTVYSLTGRKSATTQVLARQLQIAPSRFKGKRIMGREENLLDVVRNNADAVSYNVTSLIYDVKSRQPVSGLTVLAVDLDGNGKVTDEERNAIENLDTLTGFLSAHPKNSLPTGNVDINTENVHLKNFVNWTRTEGYSILAQYGLLKADRQLALVK